MIGVVGDEKEAEEDRPFTPPPPPPVVHASSPLQALASTPPVLPMAMVGLDPRRPSTPSASPSPSASEEEEEQHPLEGGDASAACDHAQAGLRLRVNSNRCSIRDAAAPTDSVFSIRDVAAPTKSAQHLLQNIKPAADVDIGDDAAADDGEAGLYYLLVEQQAKSGDAFRAGNESRPTYVVSTSESEDQSIETSESEDDLLDAADGETIIGLQSPVNIFRQWAAERPPHLLQHIQYEDSGAHLALEEDLVVRQEAKGEEKEKVVVKQQQVAVDLHLGTLVKDDRLRTARYYQDVVEQDAIHPRGETTCAIAAEDQEKVGSAENVDAVLGQDLVEQVAIDRKGECTEGIVAKDKDKGLESSDTYGLGETGAKYDQEAVEQDAIHPRDETTCDMAAEDQGKVGSGENVDAVLGHDDSVKYHTEGDLVMGTEASEVISGGSCSEEPIKITITEKFDTELIIRTMIRTDICGKIVVQFPPQLDRRVEFSVDTCHEFDFIANPRVDRELFNIMQVMRSQRFQEGPFELLKWKKRKGRIPVLLEVTADTTEAPAYTKDVSMRWVVITCLPMTMRNMRNVVLTIPFPRVDHTGVERKTRRHVWKSTGTHLEMEDCIEWHIPHLGPWDKRAEIIVDAYCYDGWQEPSQFYPIRLEFSYDQSIGSEVSRVVRSGDGRVVDFRQETVGHFSCIFHHPNELTRRAAEAADEALAWEVAPWDPWEEEDLEQDNFV